MGVDLAQDLHQEESIKRKRGRPRKLIAETTKRRGRPRKYTTCGTSLNGDVPPGFKPLHSLTIPLRLDPVNLSVPEPKSPSKPEDFARNIGPMGLELAQYPVLEEPIKRKRGRPRKDAFGSSSNKDQSRSPQTSVRRSWRLRRQFSSGSSWNMVQNKNLQTSLLRRRRLSGQFSETRLEKGLEEPITRKRGRPTKGVSGTSLSMGQNRSPFLDPIRRRVGRPRKHFSGPCLIEDVPLQASPTSLSVPQQENKSKLEILIPIYGPMGPYPAQDLQPEVSIKRKRGRPRKETSGSSQMGRNQSLETSFQRSGGLSGQFPGPCMAVETLKLGPPLEENGHSLPLEVPSSSQEQSNTDPLSMLQPFVKPQPRNKLTQEQLKQSLSLAEGVKTFFVSRLTSMTDIKTMITAANDAFSTLNFLHDDYESFHGDICELIRCNQELLIHSDDAKKALLDTEKNLKIAVRKQMPLVERTAKAREVLCKLEEMLAASIDEVKALEAERDRLSEAFSVGGAETPKYNLSSQDAEMRQHDEIMAGITRIHNKYLTSHNKVGEKV